MCNLSQGIFENGVEQGLELGIKLGLEHGIQLTKKVFKLKQEGLSLEEIANQCELSVQEVKEILE